MILDEIVACTKRQLEDIKLNSPVSELERLALAQPPAKSLSSALAGGGIKLIAEVKKASPSRGVICRNIDPVRIAGTYAAGGASAVSVLTEPEYFQGSLSYLKEIRDALGDSRPPLLRKDFICDSYQLLQARAYGADSLLLIVAVLSPGKLEELLKLSHGLGMECLVEVHDRAELETALETGAKIIGINNRDLNTFEVDIKTTERLMSCIPGGRIVVSESGIRTREDMFMLESCGVSAALVGETLVSSSDIASKIKELLA
jgi:indole-3-glycerol phosphate synthase